MTDKCAPDDLDGQLLEAWADADEKPHRATIAEAARLLRIQAAEIARLRAALREARQYVSDAGDDEDPETQRHSGGLLAQIDKLLSAGKQI